MPVYSFAGLRIASPIELSGQLLDGEEADVVVSLEPVAPHLDHPVVSGAQFQGRPGHWLGWNRKVRIEVVGGSRIKLDLAQGTSLWTARLALEQRGLVALLQMRGDLPIHASAVEQQGAAHLFMGPNQAGKSSLAACLSAARASHLRAICDDLCAIAPGTPAWMRGTGQMLKVPSDLCARLPQLVF